jgi:prephenate dehydrogenase
MNFGTVAILGPGLIGGSLALALAERGLADKLVIYARKDTSFPAIRTKLPQTELTLDVHEAVRNADIVVLCVPIEAMSDLVKKFVGSLKPTALVTDVGSVKGSVEKEVAPLLKGRALWIGSHPMAGSEMSGFSSARANLFHEAIVILTPPNWEKNEAFNRASEFWAQLGAQVRWIDPEYHDLAIAEISHLPHFLASLLIYRLTDVARQIAGANLPYSPEVALAFAGSGFRDTTRVASGSPELWTEILWANREALAMHLGSLMQILSNLREGVFRNSNEEQAKKELFQMLKIAQDRRTQLLNNSFVS